MSQKGPNKQNTLLIVKIMLFVFISQLNYPSIRLHTLMIIDGGRIYSHIWYVYSIYIYTDHDQYVSIYTYRYTVVCLHHPTKHRMNNFAKLCSCTYVHIRELWRPHCDATVDDPANAELIRLMNCNNYQCICMYTQTCLVNGGYLRNIIEHLSIISSPNCWFYHVLSP